MGLLISACVLAVFAFVGAGLVGQQAFISLQAPSQLLTKEVEIPIPADQKTFLINIQRPELASRNSEFPITVVQESQLYNLIPTDDQVIRVVYSYDIKTTAQSKDKKKLNLISENLASPVYEWEDSVLQIGLSGDQLFDAVVPYLPISYSVDLYIPKDLKFRFSVDE